MASYLARRFRKHKRALLAISSVAVITGITLVTPAGLPAARADALTPPAISVTQQAGDAESSAADVTAYAIATAVDPFTLTTKSKTIYAEATYKETFGNEVFLDRCGRDPGRPASIEQRDEGDSGSARRIGDRTFEKISYFDAGLDVRGEADQRRRARAAAGAWPAGIG